MKNSTSLREEFDIWTNNHYHQYGDYPEMGKIADWWLARTTPHPTGTGEWEKEFDKLFVEQCNHRGGRCIREKAEVIESYISHNFIHRSEVEKKIDELPFIYTSTNLANFGKELKRTFDLWKRDLKDTLLQ